MDEPQIRSLIQLDGTEQYAKYVDKLIAKVRAAGVAIPPCRSSLAEYAITLLGLSHGLRSPKRLKMGKGGRREGAGRKAQKEPPSDPAGDRSGAVQD